MLTTARDVALEVINKANKQGSYANLLLPRLLEKNHLEAKDKALATQLAYGTLRNRGTLDWLVRQYTDNDKKINNKVMDILRMGAYQVYFLDRVPDSAAINEAVELSKKYFPKQVSDFINAILRKISTNKDKVDFEQLKGNFDEYLSVKYSHPLWMTKMFIERFGRDEAEAICEANNKTPDINIRVNTIRISVEALENLLIKKGFKFKRSKLVDDSFILDHHGAIDNIFGYTEGLFSVQDQSSTLVGRAVDPQPKESLIDACAAPGGKAVHMASMMKNKGTIIAVDASSARLALLDALRKRLEIKNIIPLAVDARRLTMYVKRTVDKILVDAPCSGLGTLARRPDERWHKNEDVIYAMSQLQIEILDSVTSLVRKGGNLIYSVCTITADETDDLVETFLSYHPEFEVEEITLPLPKGVNLRTKYGIQILPHHFNSDGMYVARFVKKK